MIKLEENSEKEKYTPNKVKADDLDSMAIKLASVYLNNTLTKINGTSSFPNAKRGQSALDLLSKVSIKDAQMLQRRH